MGTGIVVDPESADSPGTITGLGNNTLYSIVVVADKEQYPRIFSNVGQVFTIGYWEQELDDFAVTQGQNPGELTYSFSATVPAAETYTLYYIEDEENDTEAIIAAQNSNSVTPTTPESPRTISGLKFNTNYSLVIVAERDNFPNAFSGVIQIRTAQSDWDKGLEDLQVSQSGNPGEINYIFNETDPPAETYTLYYAEGSNFANTQALINAAGSAGTIANTKAEETGTITGLKNDTTYSVVVLAQKDDYIDTFSGIFSANTMNVVIHTSIQESGLDTVVTWSFDIEGTSFSPESAITMTYNYSGLKVVDGRLTDDLISGTGTAMLANNAREYAIPYITHGGLVAVTDIVVSLFDGTITSAPRSSSPIELRLYNVVYSKASEYGALEMFSHGFAAAEQSVKVAARASTIVNYNESGSPTELYGATFSRGYDASWVAELFGSANGAATQLREWYYDGEYLYGRSNGGNTNIVDGTGATGAVTPSATAARWANINSVLGTHTGKWTPFSNAFAQDPFNYVPYNINTAYTGIHEFMYPNPSGINNNQNLQGGRSNAPFGLI